MKTFYTILFLFLVACDISSQSNKIDSLISDINNNQLYGTCNYVWVLKMNSSAGDSLIKIGNPATEKLIEILDNRDKGIIGHYILVVIRKIPYSFSSSFEHFLNDSILDYEFAGLKFSEKYGHFYTTDQILISNKRKWMEGNFTDPDYINYDTILYKNPDQKTH